VAPIAAHRRLKINQQSGLQMATRHTQKGRSMEWPFLFAVALTALSKVDVCAVNAIGQGLAKVALTPHFGSATFALTAPPSLSQNFSNPQTLRISKSAIKTS
jgi:hypothetical protein